jgi:hypothetical protein
VSDKEQQGRLIGLAIVGGLFGAVAWWALGGKRESYFDRYQSSLDASAPAPAPEPVVAPEPKLPPTVTQVVADPSTFFEEAG